MEMETGFLIDQGFTSEIRYLYQTKWHPGTPEEKKFLGFNTGDVKTDKLETRKVTTYRCPQCNLLRSYAETDD